MNIFVVGAADQARICQRILAAEGHSCRYVYDENRDIVQPWPDCVVFSEDLEKVMDFSLCKHFVICIADVGRGRRRLEFATKLKAMQCMPYNVIHPRAHIDGNVSYGENLQIMAGAQLLHQSVLGDYCILGPRVSIDHDTIIGDGVTIMSGAVVCGRITIGDGSTIGAGATILPKLAIGADAIVGAGAVVTKNVPAGATVVGIPARVI